MRQLWLLLFFLPLLNSARYDGYEVYEIFAKEQKDYRALVELERIETLDFWTAIRTDGPTEVMASPHQKKLLLDYLNANAIPYNVKIENVQKLIDAQDGNKKRQGPSPSARYNMTWDSYYRYDDILEFVYELASVYPNLVSVSPAGYSYEGREIPFMKISSGGDGAKNAIFVDAGIHACEWISPATVTYIIRELVENYEQHPQYVDNVDWFFMPLVNPDGYEFTHVDSRLWRKNRRPHDDINSTCIGTDINRNFDFHFGGDGSSENPCAPTFNGGEPFTETESRTLRDAILSVANQAKAYLTVHSYGQHWLTPWGWTTDLPEDYDQLYALGVEAVAALSSVYGTVYDVGSSANLLYANSGPSDDWAKGVAGIAYSYTIELRDQGPVYGFLLPPDQIMPSGIETWEAFKVVADAVAQMKR